MLRLACAFLLAIVTAGCAASTAPPPAPACVASVDPRAVEILDRYARSVEALQALAATQANARNDVVIERMREIDRTLRTRQRDAVAIERRLGELTAEVLTAAKTDAERSRTAVVLAEIGNGRADRGGASLPSSAKESAAFRAFGEALAKRDAIERDVTALEAQLVALDGIRTTAPPTALPASAPGPRSIDPRL